MEFDLSFKFLLPDNNDWLIPEYISPGNAIISKYINKKVNLPSNWEEDFPEYNYEIPELIFIKNQLNNKKHEIDRIREIGELPLFEKISAEARILEPLRGKYGIIKQQFGAEIVTNAWLKLFECLPLIKDHIENALAKRDQFFSFHFAEAPGNFVLALNHYMRTNFPGKKWKWYAESYRDFYGKNVYYLSDQYGIIRNFPENWNFGADGDGDITSTANIRSWAQLVETGCDFVTSDVKFMAEENYDEEEMINIPVHLGQLLCALQTLRKGGIMMLKVLTLLESPSVCLLMVMIYCFKKIKIIKPETSKAANSEVYIFGFDYQKNLTTLQMSRLMHFLNYIRGIFFSGKKKYPALFKKKDLNSKILQKIIEIGEILAKHQITNIDRNIQIYKQYKYVDYKKRIAQDFGNAREEAVKKWIKKTGILPLNSKYHMMIKSKRI